MGKRRSPENWDQEVHQRHRQRDRHQRSREPDGGEMLAAQLFCALTANAAHGGEFTVDDEVVTEQELAEEILATYQRLESSG